MVWPLHLFIERTVSPTHLPNSPVKPHAVLADNMSRVSVIIHQLLFAKTIPQTAQG